MLRRFISITSFSLVAGSLAPMFPAAADTVPTEFIRTLGNQALEVIRDNSFPYKAGLFPAVIPPGFRPTRHIPLCSRPILAGCERTGAAGIPAAF
jgi:hypothetical protein